MLTPVDTLVLFSHKTWLLKFSPDSESCAYPLIMSLLLIITFNNVSMFALFVLARIISVAYHQSIFPDLTWLLPTANSFHK